MHKVLFLGHFINYFLNTFFFKHIFFNFERSEELLEIKIINVINTFYITGKKKNKFQ